MPTLVSTLPPDIYLSYFLSFLPVGILRSFTDIFLDILVQFFTPFASKFCSVSVIFIMKHMLLITTYYIIYKHTTLNKFISNKIGYSCTQLNY